MACSCKSSSNQATKVKQVVKKTVTSPSPASPVQASEKPVTMRRQIFRRPI